MDKIIEKKSNVDKAVHELLCVWTEIESHNYNDIDELNKKNDILNKANMKLIDEITTKDKIISTDKKTICDYEKQINSLCVNEVKEEEGNKFGMLKAKDKEVNNLNKTVESLKKELELVNSKLEMVTTTNNITCEVVDNPVEESVSDPVEESELKTVIDVENDTESDEEISYVTIKHKKLKYYVEKDNPNSKMYTILPDGDVGEEVGEMKDGKKKLNK